MILGKPKLIVFFIVAAASVINTVITVHISRFADLSPYVLWSFGFLAISSTSGMYDEDNRDGRTDSEIFRDFLGGLVFLAVIVPIIITLIFSFYISLKDIYTWATLPTFGRYQTTFFVALISTLLAYSLFIFRLYKRTIYGMTELLVGLLVSVHHALSINAIDKVDPTFFLAILTAGIYLMVRGFDNMYVGMSEKETLISRLKNETKIN